MEKEYRLKGFTIKATLEEGIIRIQNDSGLRALLNDSRLANSELLAGALLEDYHAVYGRRLDIAPDSLIAEIWGHVYIGYFTGALQELMKIAPLKLLADKVAGYCAVIDCGEADKDSNRFIWDLLSGQIRRIDQLLPEKISKEL